MIHRDVEETLNLSRVEVQAHHARRAGRDEKVGHHLGRQRDPSLLLAILARIAEVGHHDVDVAGRGAMKRVDREQQLHQVVVDRRAGRLDDKTIRAPHVIENLYGGLFVGKPRNFQRSFFDLQNLADFFGKMTARGPAEDHQFTFADPFHDQAWFADPTLEGIQSGIIEKRRGDNQWKSRRPWSSHWMISASVIPATWASSSGPSKVP